MGRFLIFPFFFFIANDNFTQRQSNVSARLCLYGVSFQYAAVVLSSERCIPPPLLPGPIPPPGGVMPLPPKF